MPAKQGIAVRFIVELHTRNMHGAHLETWKYSSERLALCRVTQLLIANPSADLIEETVEVGEDPLREWIRVTRTTFRMELS